MNYFELFALPPHFEINLTELKSSYLELQRAVHPDKYANASERERLLAVQKAAQVNDAFNVLKASDSRAQYLLELSGIELAHETQTLKDPMFLMQQMELRETLEDISGASDPESALIDFQQEIDGYIKQINLKFVELFANSSDSNLSSAADLVRKLKFMLKLRDEAIRLEDDIIAF